MNYSKLNASMIDVLSKAMPLAEKSLVKTSTTNQGLSRIGLAHSESLRCMVVSSSDKHSEIMQEAAQNAGWHVNLFSDAMHALRASFSMRFHFSLIDISQEGYSQSPACQNLCRSFVKQKGNLLVICGQEDDVAGEVWARSIGAWIHLAGPGTQTGLTKICREAADFVSQLMIAKTPLGIPLTTKGE